MRQSTLQDSAAYGPINADKDFGFHKLMKCALRAPTFFLSILILPILTIVSPPCSSRVVRSAFLSLSSFFRLHSSTHSCCRYAIYTHCVDDLTLYHYLPNCLFFARAIPSWFRVSGVEVTTSSSTRFIDHLSPLSLLSHRTQTLTSLVLASCRIPGIL